MPRTADDVLRIDLRDEGVFQQQGRIGFPKPRGKTCLESLLKKPADIAEICHPEHHLRKINLIP